MDSNIKIIQDPVTLIEKYIEISPVSVPKHFSRNCIYKEVEQCVLEKKITEENGRDMLNLLSAHSFPKEYGLGENNIIIRKHNHKDVIRLMNYWWEYFNQGAKRDQLTLFFYHGNMGSQSSSWMRRQEIKIITLDIICIKRKKLPLMKRSYLFMKANRQRVYFYDCLCKLYLFLKK
ncbi:glycosyltransferase domain-containing protein [Klebsiella pneumoniae]|uniref:glycosyltransferase domain-containing protein n=1 Tax=Klebsiella pneumoniae TaxID=573 RepID=UPI001E5F8F20|nr:glycosyltransferase domain-containing protein [Klebsiella pneumoniae]